MDGYGSRIGLDLLYGTKKAREGCSKRHFMMRLERWRDGTHAFERIHAIKEIQKKDYVSINDGTA